jgi:hypothetical protein
VVTAVSPKELSQFRWIKTVLGNLKTSLSGTLHNVELRKYARRYLSGYLFRFHQRFTRNAMTARIANAACMLGVLQGEGFEGCRILSLWILSDDGSIKVR